MNLAGKFAFMIGYYLVMPVMREVRLKRTVLAAAKIMRVAEKVRDIRGLSEGFTERQDINIHMLCSHGDLDSLLISLSAFYVFSSELTSVVVHEDGSFTDRDVSILKNVFPWVEYVPLKEADERLRAAGFSEETISIRHRHSMMIKAVDFHHIRGCGRILSFDTDVFVLGGMGELWASVRAGGRFTFNRDKNPAYGSARDLLSVVLGQELPKEEGPFLNAGFAVEPAELLREKRDILERYCAGLDSFPFRRVHCAEQGYIAYLLKYLGIEGKSLSSHYSISGCTEPAGVEHVKKYDLETNKDGIETIHLCGWDKSGKDFRAVKRKLFRAMWRRMRKIKEVTRGRRIRVGFYPNSVLDWPNPFWRILRDALAAEAVEVLRMPFSVRGLALNRGKVDAMHFHYVYPEAPAWTKTLLPDKIGNKLWLFYRWYNAKMFEKRLKFAKKLGYKIVYTVHNLKFHDKQDNAAEKNLTLIYKLADTIVVMGENDKIELKKTLHVENIKEVPHFHFERYYENKITKKEARKKLKIKDDRYVFLFFGAIRGYKGVDGLIETFKKTKIDALLLIAGCGSQEPEYAKQLVALAVGDKRIRIQDKRIADDEIQTYMNAADLVVFPFRQISNSSALILAKSFYKPTICMDRGNIKDHTSPDTDILVKDEHELERALVEAVHRDFPADKERYVKGIPSPQKAAAMYKNIYGS